MITYVRAIALVINHRSITKYICWTMVKITIESIDYRKDVTDWDSNYGKSNQMLLRKTQIKTPCHANQGGEKGNLSAFSVHLSFYKLFPL